MAKKSKDERMMMNCTECNAQLKVENYERHMLKVHGKEGCDPENLLSEQNKQKRRWGRRAGETKGEIQTVNCTECDAQIKAENYEKHISKVHDKRDGRKGRLEGRAEERMLQVEQIRMKKRRTVFFIAFNILFISAIALALYVTFFENTDNSYSPSEGLQYQEGADQIKIPAANITDEVSFYHIDSDGVDIRFFAVRGSDDHEHVAFDACDSCHPEKKGYRQAGNNMKCNNCQREFAINAIGTENTEGGCWPSYLPMEQDGGYIVIEKADLEEKRYMFE